MVDDVYLDDNERAERVKQWWKDNGLAIVGGAALGLVAIFGYRAWESGQQAHMEAAAGAFETLQASAETLSAEDLDTRMTEFREKYSDTPYASLASLEAGVQYYRVGEPDKAESAFQHTIDNGNPAELRDVARVRLARLTMDRGELEPALAVLDQVEGESFASLVNELRGDALARLGRIEEARAAYETARETSVGETTRFLDVKIASLGSGILEAGDEGS